MRLACKSPVSGCDEMQRNAACGAKPVRAPYAHRCLPPLRRQSSTTLESLHDETGREKLEAQGMTKQEFIDAVAARAGLTKREAGSAVDAALDVIESTLQNGDSITFTGFGKFHVTRRAARQGVNPRTGERVAIGAANVPKFSPGSRLKSAIKVGGSGWAGDVVAADSEGNPIEPWRRRP
jgi:DNA-binding protein HU-beta